MQPLHTATPACTHTPHAAAGRGHTGAQARWDNQHTAHVPARLTSPAARANVCVCAGSPGARRRSRPCWVRTATTPRGPSRSPRPRQPSGLSTALTRKSSTCSAASREVRAPSSPTEPCARGVLSRRLNARLAGALCDAACCVPSQVGGHGGPRRCGSLVRVLGCWRVQAPSMTSRPRAPRCAPTRTTPRPTRGAPQRTWGRGSVSAAALPTTRPTASCECMPGVRGPGARNLRRACAA